jgi:hypothetical protein
MINITRKMTKSILAKPAAVPAIPPKPNTPAIIAMIRKVTAQLSIIVLLLLVFKKTAKNKISPTDISLFTHTALAQSPYRSFSGKRSWLLFYLIMSSVSGA